MIRQKIKQEMTEQKKTGVAIIDSVVSKGAKLTAGQLSNFLSGKSMLNIKVVELILDELNLVITKAIEVELDKANDNIEQSVDKAIDNVKNSLNKPNHD